MRHEAHVGLVDAHAEGDRGHHHHAVLAQEALLVLRARGRVEPGVVRQGLDARLGQPLRGVVHFAPAQAIDDAGLALVAEQELAQLALRVVAQAHAIADVGSVETGDELARVLQRQTLDDLLACARVGGGGERDARHRGKALRQDRQLAVLGAEIVAPLRHAVRLVDGEQRHLGAFEQIEEARRQQPLRRHVEQVQRAGEQLLLDLALRVGGQAGVEVGRCHARLAQGVDLILHQRDQRRYHDRRALPQQGGNLIAQRLAAAGGHQHQRVATLPQMFDDGLLLAAEAWVTEGVAKDIEGRLMHPGNASKWGW